MAVGALRTMPTVYLDNAATSWPKPPQVIAAMKRFLDEVGANPGRSGHRRSVEAARVVYRAREAVADLVGVADPLRVVFCPNGTHALNLALCGLLDPGDHVVTTSMEHNSVMRPLRALEAEGAAVTVVGCSPEGVLDPKSVEQAIRAETRMIVMTHASNVVGTVMPVKQVAAIARTRGLLLLVDAAQSLGAMPVAMDDIGADLLAFTGHKAMSGPMGTGGLVIGERVDVERMRPLVRGGTGSDSEREVQPGVLPDKFESGTANAVGLAGLEAGLRWLASQGIEAVRDRERGLTARMIDGLAAIAGLRVHGTGDAERQLPVISFTLAGRDPAEVARELDERSGVCARVGLHCSPAAHKTLGTFPTGTVRFSLGASSTRRDVDRGIQAVWAVAQSSPKGARP